MISSYERQISLVVTFLFIMVNLGQAYWIRDLSFCPRKRDVARQRQCFKSCFDDSDCRSRYRLCACDFDCGMSCIKRGITCPFLTTPEHGQISYSNGNKFGSRATYECDQGYILEGPKHRFCQGDTWWGPSDVVPYCVKEVFCPRPVNIHNAVNDIPSTITSFHAGYKVTYTCLRGYVGTGTTTSECTFLGQWTFATLKCTPIDCGLPGILKNGFLSGERFDYPNIIGFFCNDGYELIGKDTTRACQENGLWSGTMPVCEKKTCRAPPLVSHSEIIQPDRTTNETIQYICQPGYRLVGSAILKCLDSVWQPSPPLCEQITCQDPLLSFNGEIEGFTSNETSMTTTFYPIDSLINFRCPSNMTLRGSRYSQCQQNGTWLPKLPRCDVAVPCEIPPLPKNAVYTHLSPLVTMINDGDHLEYRCANSFHRHRVQCRQGQILPRLPRCYQGCHVTNTEITYSKSFYRHREYVYYTCHNNSIPISPNETIRCINGNLSSTPVCQTMKCTVPHMLFLRHIINTTLASGTLIDVGFSFSYVCMEDHQPVVESATVQCLSHGELSHDAQCVPQSCREHPPSINNGRSIFHSMKHGSIAKYRCLPGFRLENIQFDKVTCHYGRWLPQQQTKCIPIFCSSPEPILNGRVYVLSRDDSIPSKMKRIEFLSAVPNIFHGRTIEFECHPGFVLQGPPGLTCNHGRWMPSERARCVQACV